MMRAMSSMRCAPVALAVALACASASAADWTQFGYDAAHTGFNPQESSITRANVASMTMRYSANLASSVDSAPVYLSNVQTSAGTKNMLFALSKNGRLMAIDAANGTEIWHATTTGNQPTTSPTDDGT